MTPGTVSSHRSSPSAMTGFWTLPAQRRRGLRSGQRGQVSHKRSFVRRLRDTLKLLRITYAQCLRDEMVVRIGSRNPMCSQAWWGA